MQNNKRGEKAMCKSLGTLLDYALSLLTAMITKVKTQMIYLLGL